MTDPPEALGSMLARLGLPARAAELDDVLAQAAKARWSARQLLEHVPSRELDERAVHGLQRRLGRAMLGSVKLLPTSTGRGPSASTKSASSR